MQISCGCSEAVTETEESHNKLQRQSVTTTGSHHLSFCLVSRLLPVQRCRDARENRAETNVLLLCASREMMSDLIHLTFTMADVRNRVKCRIFVTVIGFNSQYMLFKSPGALEFENRGKQVNL